MKYVALFLSVLAAAQAADISVTAHPSYSAVVCPMTVCPTATALVARDIECPDYCDGKCKIIDDVCCPGTQKVVCDEIQTYNGTITVGNSSPIVSAFASSTATAASTTPTVASGTTQTSLLPSSTSTSGAPQATQSAPSSGATSNHVDLSSMCLMMLGALAIQAL